MTAPYYSDDLVTLYLGDCRKITEWLAADVLVTDPPYGSGALAGLYGRTPSDAGRGRVIAQDATTDTRDLALRLWGARPVAVFGTPRMSEPPGTWRDRLVWDKREPGLNGGPWRYTHESIFVGGDGWKRQSASSFSILSAPSGNGTWEKSQHAHSKPVALMGSLIMSAPPRSDRRPVRRFRLHARDRKDAGPQNNRRGAGRALLRDRGTATAPGRPPIRGGRMTAPLFTDRDPCGCERALGHVCRPPWMDATTWPDYLQTCKSPDRMKGYKSGPRSGVDAPNESEGLTPNKEGLMHSILPARLPSSGGR